MGRKQTASPSLGEVQIQVAQPKGYTGSRTITERSKRCYICWKVTGGVIDEIRTQVRTKI